MRALIVTYVFPPVGGAGVGRTLKLAKYLPEHGVTPAVLTCANPSVPVYDPSLLADVSPTMTIDRARTFEPDYRLKQATWQSENEHGETRSSMRSAVVGRLGKLAKAALVPDPQILWQPHAQLRLARRLIAGLDDVVFISGPPFSQFLLAPLCRLRPGTAVVLDYRDEWSTYRTSYEMMGRAGRAIGPALERSVLRTAHAVTTATEAFRQHLLDQFSFLDPDRVYAIPNGFDPDDFPADLPAPPSDRLVISYAGTVFKLTSARGLVAGLRLLHEREPELAGRLEVRFVGRIVDSEMDAFADGEALGIELLGYVDKARVAHELAGSHMVLCLLDDVPGTERIYPGKIFELMYLGRPCMTLSPPGALTELVRRHQLGPIAHPRDAEAIFQLLRDAVRRHRDGQPLTDGKPVDIGRYHRRAQAGQFAQVFAEALARARA